MWKKTQEERPFTHTSKFTNMEQIKTVNRSVGEGDICQACVRAINRWKKYGVKSKVSSKCKLKIFT